jgi:hypothetical protein
MPVPALATANEQWVPTTQRHTFAIILSIEVAVAVLARVVYALTIGKHLTLGLDSIAYVLLGGSLAHGGGYSNPALYFAHGISKPTANWVPGYPLFLSLLQRLTITSATGFRLAGAICGGVTVLLTGIFGRRVSGRRSVGLIAAGLVAVSPALIAADGSIMSETIAIPLTVGVLLAASWAGGTTSLLRWLLVGGLVGCLVMVRSEDLLTAVVLVPLAVLVAPSVGIRRKVLQAGTVLLVVVAVLAPWAIRNYVTFHPHVYLSTNAGKTLAGANCPTTYQGPLIGYWDDSCIGHAQLADTNEVKYDQLARAQGTHYIQTHLGRVPLVVGIRVLRAWGLFDPLQVARLEVLQTRSIGFQQIAWPASLLVLALAIPGLILLRKDRFALVLVAGPAVLATLVVAVSFGNPRYVLPATPSLCVAAGVAGRSLIDRWRRQGTQVGDGHSEGDTDRSISS